MNMQKIMNIKISHIKIYFFLFFFATIYVAMVLLKLQSPLIGDASPLGILSFELAGSMENLQKVIFNWGSDGIAQAVQVTIIDYAFLGGYSMVLILACVWIANSALEHNNSKLARLASLFALIGWLSGFFDAIENAISLKLLLYAPEMPWPWMMALIAAIKFSLLILSLLFLIKVFFSNIATKRKLSNRQS